tara:strand:- start:6 stop:470 length:465 start_codon:yes stop_codon:yes gene_type:complete
MNKIDILLKEKNIIIPNAPTPAANYVPYVITNNLIFVAGQGPFENGKINYTGKVGESIDIETAIKVARICGLNILGVLKLALNGDLSKIKKCVKLGIFVACVDSFKQQPEVANGASDLMVEVFGESGKHARFAVGTNSLPRHFPVEVDAIFEIS